jgi:SpoVK/Ycf46/Vps4 family AAA+-type ATPase
MFKQSLEGVNIPYVDLPMLVNLSNGFSGSDIAVVIQEVMMQPIRAIVKANHFKVSYPNNPMRF